MADDSGIDPRYAAQFQRGYDPTRHRAAPPPEPRAEGGPPRLPGGPVGYAERVRERSEPRTVAPPSAPVSVEHDPLDSGDDPVPQRARIEWVLPVAAVVLLVAAGVFFRGAQDAFGSGGPTSYVLFLTGASIPGPLVVAAVICLTAWLMLRALRGGTR